MAPILLLLELEIMVVYFLLSMLIFWLHGSIVVPQTLEMLEKKEGVLLKKAAGEVERAKEFSKAKNKRGNALTSFF